MSATATASLAAAAASAMSVVVVSAPLMDDSTQRLTRLDSTLSSKNHQNNKMCMRLAIFDLLFGNFSSVETIAPARPIHSIPVGSIADH